jgi:hypothetical protein
MLLVLHDMLYSKKNYQYLNVNKFTFKKFKLCTVHAYCLLVLMSVIPLNNLYAQIDFEAGYFIDRNGARVNCLIRNLEWKYNPPEFKYKATSDGETLTGTLETIQEFGIFSARIKYVKASIKVDQSSGDMAYLSASRTPDFKIETIFLKVLVEGKASLYEYSFGNELRFYYSLDTKLFEPLIYKKFYSGGHVLENDSYKQQLYNALSCSGISQGKFENIQYRKKDLENIFIQYNKCVQSSLLLYTPTKKKDWLHFSVRPGLSYQSFKVNNSVNVNKSTSFSSQVGFRLGLEMEFVLPYNKNKWRILFEPTLRNYKADDNEVNLNRVAEVKYNSIEMPVGLRHLFYINTTNSFFVNALFAYDLPFNSTINFYDASNNVVDDLEIAGRTNFMVGAGYNWANKFSVELRYSTPRNILGNVVYWRSTHQGISVLAGYRLF